MINDDYDLAKSIEDSGTLKESKYFQQGILLCRLWLTYGWEESKIKDSLYKRIDVLYPLFGNTTKEKDVEKIYEHAKNAQPLKRLEISFSNAELQYIHSLDNIQEERLLFGFLYLWKINGCKEYEIFTLDLMKAASVNWNHTWLQKYITWLVQNGYITNRMFKYKLLYSVSDELKSLYDENDVAFTISVQKNIGYYYLDYIHDGTYYFCNRCGCIELATGKRKNYCKECAKIEHQKQKNISKKKAMETFMNRNKDQ